MAVNIYEELLALGARLAKVEAALAPKLKVAVPSYFRPGTSWDQMLANRPALVCINPGSGPGTTPSTSYPAQVAKAHGAGAKVLGYVHTRYGVRPIAEVKADVDKHQQWYAVSGIFVDTTSNDPALVPYYEDLCSYIKGKGLFVCLNPGTRCPERLAQIADAVMVVETDLARYLTHTHNAWEVNYPGKLWHCIHTCPESEMPKVVATAKARGAGYVLVTQDVMPNPYDGLPAYWNALCAEVARAA